MNLTEFRVSPQEHLYGVGYTQDGKYAAVACGNGTIEIFKADDLSTKVFSRNAVGAQKDLPCTTVKWLHSSGGEPYRLASTSSSGTVSLWNWDGTVLENTKSITEEGNEPLCLDISPNGNLIATGGKDRVVRVYTKDFELNATLTRKRPDDFSSVTAHVNRIFSVRFLTPNTLMSAGWESPIQVWNLQTSFAEKQVFGVKSESDCIEVIPGTTAVVICSGSIESPIVVVESSQCCVLEKETERLRKAVVGGENPIMSRYCKDSSTLWVLYLHSVKAIAYHTGAVLGSVELPAPGNSITLAPNAVGRAVVACQRGTLAEIRLNM